MTGLIERLTRSLVRRGIRDGLMGGSGAWLALGAGAWLLRFLMHRPSGRVITEKIRLGETITVTSAPAPPFGRKARRLAKVDRKEAELQRRRIKSERRRAHEVVVAAPSPPALPSLRD
ncbi:MAG: hypothetical protein ACRD0Z_17675 [Acidimicrobiales bacterium]